MRVVQLFFFTVFLVQNAFAQDFARPDSKFVFQSLNIWAPGIMKMTFEKDTISDGRELRKFDREFTLIPRGIGDTIREKRSSFFFHSKNGVIEFSDDLIHFDTLFNFNASIGQKWNIYYNYFRNISDSMEVEILDTFRIDFAGRKLIAQSVKYSRNGQLDFYDTVIENLGNKWHYFLPWDIGERGADGGHGGPIKCFQNNELGTISFENSPDWSWIDFDCDEISDKSFPVFEKAKIYPNPFRDFLTVESSSGGSFFLKKYLGKTLSKIWISYGKNEVDLQSLQPGVYFLSIENETFKIIKQ